MIHLYKHLILLLYLILYVLLLVIIFCHTSVMSLLIVNFYLQNELVHNFKSFAALCSFHIVYFETLYLAISWFSYSPPESTRGVLRRSSLVLWWIAIILLISLVPAAHQLNCWILLMLILASAILLKSTVALEVSPKEMYFKVRHKLNLRKHKCKLDLFYNWLEWVPQGSHLM